MKNVIFPIVISASALLLATLHLLCPTLAIDHITLVLLAIAVAPWLYPFVKSLEAPGGWKLELRHEIQREIEKITVEALPQLSALDMRLVDFFERKQFLQSADVLERLELIRQTVERLESDFAKASDIEKLSLGLALREIYWRYLQEGRDAYASSAPYHDIKVHVLRGFQMLAGGLAPENTAAV